MNVTLHCHNFTNILMWDYDHLTLGIKFRVDILLYSGEPEQLWVEPPDLQADLSFLSDPTNEFLITVTAVKGENESKPGPSEEGITFSYSRESLVEQKCSVDLPSVIVTTEPHDQVKFSFEHPWLLYRQKLRSVEKTKLRKKKSNEQQINERLPVFDYNVMVVNQGKPPHPYRCVDRVCEKTLHVDATKTEHCLKINGELERMSVVSRQEYCAQPGVPTSVHEYIYIIVSVVVLMSIAAVGFMIYRKHTHPASPVPPSMNFIGPLPRPTMRQDPEYTHSVLEGEPSSPTPLLTSTEEQDKRGFTSITHDDVLRLPIRGVSEDEGVSDVTEQVEPSVDGSAYMQGQNFEEDEAETGRSDYERRPVLDELAPGETVEGYRG